MMEQTEKMIIIEKYKHRIFEEKSRFHFQFLPSISFVIEDFCFALWSDINIQNTATQQDES